MKVETERESNLKETLKEEQAGAELGQAQPQLT